MGRWVFDRVGDFKMVFVGVDGLAGLVAATLVCLLPGLVTGFLGGGKGRVLSNGKVAKGRR
jgi:hypothetical protein